MECKTVNNKSFIVKRQKNPADSSLIIDHTITKCIYQNIAVNSYFLNQQGKRFRRINELKRGYGGVRGEVVAEHDEVALILMEALAESIHTSDLLLRRRVSEI